MRPSENPFASHRIEALAFDFPAGLDWRSSLARLERLDYRGAIVGTRGNGKTTLLFELKDRLEARGFDVRLERLRPLDSSGGSQGSGAGVFFEPRECARRWRAGEILLLDSAGLLGRLDILRLRCLARRARGLVVTSHGACWLPTWIECRTTKRQFQALVQQLSREIPQCERELDDLLARHRGNVREALRSLYDRFADL